MPRHTDASVGAGSAKINQPKVGAPAAAHSRAFFHSEDDSDTVREIQEFRAAHGRCSLLHTPIPSAPGRAFSRGRGVTRTVLAAVGLAVVLSGAWLMFGMWPVINIVETGRTPEYPDITPRTFQASPERVFDAAMHAVNRLPRWGVISYDEGKGEIRVEATTRMLRFVDDVTIRVESNGEGATVNVRSASRVGKSDFGQNARNIRAFLSELDRQVVSARGDH